MADPFTGNIRAMDVLNAPYAADSAASPVVSGNVQFNEKDPSRIDVVNPEGKGVSIPKESLHHALNQGYQLDSPDLKKDRELEEKYGGNDLGNETKAFGAGVARGASFGLSDLAISKLGGEDARFALEQLKKRESGASLAGQIAGVGLGLVGTAGLGEAAGAGEAATEATGILSKARSVIPGGPGAYLSKAAESLASNITGKGLGAAIARGATAGAVEGAGYGLGEGVSEASLQRGDLSPSEVAETLVTNAGIGALTGGAIGGATGAIGHGVKKALSKYMGESTTVGASTGDIVKGTNVSAKEAQAGLQAVKGNADEIISAARSLDIAPENVPQMVISGDEQAQKLWGSLAVKPGEVGERVRAPIKAYNEGIQKASESLFMDATTMSKDEVGSRLRQELTTPIKDELSSIGSQYDEIKPILKEVTVSPKAKNVLKRTFLDNELVKLDPAGNEAAAAKRYSEMLGNVKDLNDLKLMRTKLNGEINVANRAGDSNLQSVLLDIKDKVNSLRENSIARFAKSGSQGLVDSETGIAVDPVKLSGEHINRILDLDRKYAELNSKAVDLGDSLGIRGKSAKDVLRKIEENLSNEQIGNRFFDVKNAESLRSLKQNFPEQYEMLRKNYLGQIRQGLDVKGPIGGDVIGVNKLINKIDKLSPEAQKTIFNPSELERVKAIKILHKEIPPKFGPSGTPEGMAYLLDSGNVSGLAESAKAFMKGDVVGGVTSAVSHVAKSTLGRAKDEALYAMLMHGSSPIGKAVLDSEKTIYGKIFDFASTTAKQVKKNGVKVGGIAAIGSSAITHFENHQEHLDELARLSTDPNYLVKNLTDSTKAIAQAHPEVTSAIHDTVVRAVSFLQDHAPKNPGMTNAFGKVSYRPSDAELAKYDRYLKVINNPLSVLDDLNNRVLTAESVEALSNVYPDTYNKITSRATDILTDKEHKLSYQDKNQLAILLGSPVTSSQNPDFIQSMQKSFQNDITADPQQQGGGVKPSPTNFKTNEAGRTQTDLQQALGRRNA